ELGVWNLDAAARALMTGPAQGDPLEQARAAVRLAPDLPAGQMALAQALWRQGDSPWAAARTAFGALAAIPRHVQASLWFGGSLLFVLGLALVAGGLWCIALVGALSAGHAAHDLGDVLSPKAPSFARAALLASMLLAPLALGEGLVGICGVLLAIGVVYGEARQRFVLGLAAAVVVLGAFPVVRLAGTTLTVFSADPVTAAAFATAQGFTHPVDQLRIETAADSDELAAQALALRARRAGNLGQADALYQELLRSPDVEPAIQNNAANVRLNLGHMESALAIYRDALEQKPNPIILFNLSQAHGRAFQVEELSATLSEAQRLDGDLVAELTTLQGAELIGFVVDMPLDTHQIWRRILRSDAGERMAAEFRAILAPGWLGDRGTSALLASGTIAVFFAGLGGRVGRSRSCSRCGRRICPRCDTEPCVGTSCTRCTRLFQQTDTTDPELRLARINELRERERRVEKGVVLASFLVPGAAGLFAARPARSLLGSLFAATAVLAVVWRGGVVPDPLVAGASAPFAFLLLATVCLLGYAVTAILCLHIRRNL
ncbi:MAG: hypothetical protein ACE5FL_12315, partial [Myxococcota bacterium]